jgi:hypothetical protein
VRRAVLALFAGVVLLLATCGPRPSASSSQLPGVESPSLEPLQVAAVALTPGEVGLSYSERAFQWTGGVPPYTYLITGALPGGLELSNDGLLSGMPSAAGTFSLTVDVTDSTGNQAVAPNSIVIMPMLKVTVLGTGSILVESGCDTVCGLFATHSGGRAPYTYSVGSGTLPPGMSLSGTSLAGKFTSTGTYQFTVKVTDALGATTTIHVAFSVYAHIHFDRQTFNCDQAGSHPDCHTFMPFTGGRAGDSYSVNYKVLQGSPTLTLHDVSLTVGKVSDSLPDIGVALFIPVQAPKSGWSGELLITLTDQSLCGPSPGVYCSTQASVFASVSDRSGP